MKLKANSVGDLPELASKMVEWAGGEKIWVLNGEMGAGKTTLSKAIGQVLGVIDTVQSPTFSIVNEYLTLSGDSIYHFDFYRLEHPEEALAIGVEEYFDSGNLCLIEWPQKIGNLLPERHLAIRIEDLGNEQREFTLTHNGR
ncbi:MULTISPECIES: tRNA (adenosine(37)-N6)-threonylcarbamoyltransferase complex ATPase subunit type 1 TsaE [unclassified Roseivirga]|jgi:tRNA threonylcarbamoyladenosine biosynthesis protein TsaE|uniref:tRNA (adenosine(37)-N6)-threonylcarbamoyltransferase complex ATPase subunit type 1 TsaE n=1 Tax=unclassified Roseivirga TaxID=2626142 RepID=UPI00257BC384|nr:MULTISPECIES: tRNA (adenosine(37)-N6)-threonylcarbamoyltransferase complex ATPase subunit type 1 TsaE [unclassified Roseivirga]|tara:strand:+ start:1810 stop:2235 length:426 start_codon:yes stop_codon:yes gene_type:complete